MGIQKVKLKKKWNLHKVGSIVEVDDLRATWLEEHDYLVGSGRVSTTKRKEG